MRLITSSTSLIRLAVGLCLTAALAFCATPASLTAGKVDLKSAGPLAFGPDGVLFVGDSIGAAVVALDTQDTKPGPASAQLEIKGLNQKVAAMLGTSADQILINDVKVNPVSKNIYLSVSRGRGPDAMPAILKIDTAGKITALSLDNIKHLTATLPNIPDTKATGQRNDPRLQIITDIAYVDGKVLVAGLSNEEFSSNLRNIPWPFQQVDKGASIEIFHGSHGQYETKSPVRTFTPYTINGEQYILAAYTCTPLVKIPVSSLKSGAKVEGTTIAELGAGNRPLDMVPYKKDGKEYILMANSDRGVIKLSADKLETYKPITKPTDITGVPYQTVAGLRGVTQLEKYDDSHAVILTDANGSQDLRAIALP